MTENTKTLLIASFVPKITLDWFLRNLDDKFKIKKEDVFIYDVENNDLDYLLTFKIKNNKKIDFNFYFSNATIVNIKNGCIFSINGLNRLIEMETSCEQGNVNYKNHKIDWGLHKDTLILSNKNKLTTKNIKKIENIVEKT